MLSSPTRENEAEPEVLDQGITTPESDPRLHGVAISRSHESLICQGEASDNLDALKKGARQPGFDSTCLVLDNTDGSPLLRGFWKATPANARNRAGIHSCKTGAFALCPAFCKTPQRGARESPRCLGAEAAMTDGEMAPFPDVSHTLHYDVGAGGRGEYKPAGSGKTKSRSAVAGKNEKPKQGDQMAPSASTLYERTLRPAGCGWLRATLR